jgi:hypothetical protein
MGAGLLAVKLVGTKAGALLGSPWPAIFKNPVQVFRTAISNLQHDAFRNVIGM